MGYRLRRTCQFDSTIQGYRKMTLFEVLNLLPWFYPLSMVSREEVELLYGAVKRLRAKHIVELGTGFGHTTKGLGFAALETEGHVTTVDLQSGGPPRGKTWGDVNNEILILDLPVSFIIGNDLKVDIPSGIDFLFIDTLHYYDQLKAELVKYVPLMSGKGEIFIHGVLHKEVHMIGENQAILEFLQENKKWDYHILNTEFGLGRIFPRQ